MVSSSTNVRVSASAMSRSSNELRSQTLARAVAPPETDLGNSWQEAIHLPFGLKVTRREREEPGSGRNASWATSHRVIPDEVAHAIKFLSAGLNERDSI